MKSLSEKSSSFPPTMPPKGGPFLVPSSPALKKKKGKAPISIPAKSAPAAPVLTGIYTGRNCKCNIIQEFQEEYADPEKLWAELAALVKKHLWPLAPSTLHRYNRVCWLWLAFFQWLYHDINKANVTLAENAEYPPVQELKLFIKNLATKGCSGLKIESFSGWSYHTTHGFVLSIEGMVSFLWLWFFFCFCVNLESVEVTSPHTVIIKGTVQRFVKCTVCCSF